MTITLEEAECIVEHLKNDAPESASMVLDKIVPAITDKQKALYQQIGQLTRSVHEEVKSIAIDERLAIDANTLPKTQNDINYIIKTAESSANSTISAVEAIFPHIASLRATGGKLSGELDKLVNRDMQAQDFNLFIQELKAHFSLIDEIAENSSEHLNDVLMAQSFQDLTGQVAQRVSGALVTLEENLVELLKIYGTDLNFHHEEDNLTPAGPSVGANENVASNQDDVDDLLESLGF